MRTSLTFLTITILIVLAPLSTISAESKNSLITINGYIYDKHTSDIIVGAIVT